MKRKLISLLVANLFVAPVALAQQGPVFTGSVSVGVRGVDDKANDPSKLNEYRDLDSNGIGIFDLRVRSSDYYANAFGENIGNYDQYFDLWGGRYGVFKYQLYSNELRHRFSSGPGALTPFAGVGSTTLTAVFPNPTVSTWNTFDNSLKRRDLGGFVEWAAASPWYFRVDANEVQRDGIKLMSTNGTGFTGNFQPPAPVDYNARNFSAEGGYQSRRANASLALTHSRFNNGNDLLRWSNGGFAGSPLDTIVLPPDNELTKWAFNGNLKQLPMSSTLAGRFTYSKLTNDVSILTTFLTTGGIQGGTGPSTPTFHGNVMNKTASLALNSQPTRALDTKLYWNWRQKHNKSTEVSFTPTAAGLTALSNELFGYKKNNVGAEAGYRLNPQNRFLVGLDHERATRERVDFNENKDTKFFAQWKNHAFDYVDTRVKYQFLERRSNFVDPSAEITANPLARFVRRFDLANVDQNLVKVGFDIAPRPFLDFGIEAIYKKNDYKDTRLGRTEDERQELYASVSLGDPERFRVLLFGDVEYSWYDSHHRVGGVGGPDSPPAPAAPALSTSYDWHAKNHDRSWQVGLGADWKPLERLKMSGSVLWAQTRGTVDFAAQAGTILAAPGLLNIGNFDNTKRLSLNLKGTYAIDRRFDLTAGYAYERYRYSDIGFDGFAYTFGAGTGTTYFSGEQAFQNYNANILYLIGTYKF